MKFLIFILALIIMPMTSYAQYWYGQNQNVGLGTQVPGALLDVQGTLPKNVIFGGEESGSVNIGIGTSSPNGNLDVEGSVAPTIFYGNTSGNVGIGTANPGALLDVAGTFRIPSQKSTTGEGFACFDTKGELVRSVVACVGT